VFDLAGNAREWCRDMWKNYRDVSLVSDPLVEPISSEDAEPLYVIRGGSYATLTEMARVTHRANTSDFAYKAKNTDEFDDVGFRVVLEVVIAGLPSSEPPTKKESVE
jgi:formylglycine-generating enzyme required for sulfatase activity